MPVTRIDGQLVGDGAIGPLSKRITAIYWQMHDDSRYRTAVDYPVTT